VIPNDLFTGEMLPFAAWPQTPVPKGPPGVYTIWRGEEFLYVGISWREPSATVTGQSKGLWGRLDSHASGRRSGDQFCIYICDRFVLGDLDSSAITAVAEGALSLDQLTRAYVRERLGYRFIVTKSGAEARAIESLVRRDGHVDRGRPYLNPSGIRRSSTFTTYQAPDDARVLRGGDAIS
jgi:hypothetical protein